jgi:hypothetical protein
LDGFTKSHGLIVGFLTLEVVMETARNIAGASLAALLFIGAWGANSNAIAAESNAAGAKGVLLKEEYVPDSYCHQKLSAIRESSLAGDHPVLSAEETIDFYGPCNQDPLGKDQVHDQRRANTDRRSK